MLTIEGKNLDYFTDVSIGGENIEIRNIESTNDGLLKVTVFVSENAELGFKNLIATHSLFNKSATLVNGLYVGPRIGKDGENGKNGKDGKDGIDGIDGATGKDGKGFCDDNTANLMIIANNLPAGNQSTAYFDQVLCNLTLGIPVGFNGEKGATGITGATGTAGITGATGTIGANGNSGLNSLVKIIDEPKGTNCKKGGIKVESGLDSNNNNTLDANEITSTNYVCGAKDD